MDRQMVVNLIRNGVVECPPGKSWLRVIRCFEMTCRPEEGLVEVDEYEAYEVCEDGTEIGDSDGMSAGSESPSRMYHVGRSVISLKDRQVIENAPGAGWVNSDCSRDILDRSH